MRPLIGGDAMTADLADAMRAVGLLPIHVYDGDVNGTVATPDVRARRLANGVLPYVTQWVMAFTPEHGADAGDGRDSK